MNRRLGSSVTRDLVLVAERYALPSTLTNIPGPPAAGRKYPGSENTAPELAQAQPDIAYRERLLPHFIGESNLPTSSISP